MSKTARAAGPSLLYLVLLLAAWLLGLAGCGGAGSDSTPATDANPGPLRVVTTIGMIADTARRIAGPHAAVESLMGPGVDPHLYKASESDVRRLAEAELILYNGLHLEGKMADILVKMARARPVVAVSEDVPQALLREPPEFAGQYDPHIWFDVSLWAHTVEPITRELAALRPQHRAELERNAAALKTELASLDAWVKQQTETLRPEQRVLVTAHDAFGYFGRRYGFDVFGIQGISTLSEAGLRDVERIADLVVERRVKAIFVETSVPRRSVEAVQAACRSRGHDVVVGGSLFSDSMGAPGTPEGTYVGMVRRNVTTIVEALR
jgi:manganese/zinc/iron transport system substrate-binding protein